MVGCSARGRIGAAARHIAHELQVVVAIVARAQGKRRRVPAVAVLASSVAVVHGELGCVCRRAAEVIRTPNDVVLLAAVAFPQHNVARRTSCTPARNADVGARRHRSWLRSCRHAIARVQVHVCRCSGWARLALRRRSGARAPTKQRATARNAGRDVHCAGASGVRS